MTLTEFLLARITEDEEGARIVLSVGIHPELVMDPVAQQWLEHFGPARVLAECEAKRLAIEAAWADHCQIEGEWGSGQGQEQMSAKDDNPAVVEALALPYATHPDYRQEWAPRT